MGVWFLGLEIGPFWVLTITYIGAIILKLVRHGRTPRSPTGVAEIKGDGKAGHSLRSR